MVYIIICGKWIDQKHAIIQKNMTIKDINTDFLPIFAVSQTNLRFPNYYHSSFMNFIYLFIYLFILSFIYLFIFMCYD